MAENENQQTKPKVEQSLQIKPIELESLTPVQAQREDAMVLVQYEQASMLELTKSEQDALQVVVNEEEVEVRYDGIIYLPQVFVRNVLNKVIGIGQWALIENSRIKEGDSLFLDGSLYIRGKFVARGMGESDYIPSNPLSSWASAYESAKSDCLVRCCKDLGIAKEMWMPQYQRNFLKKNCIQVYRRDAKSNRNWQWRRRDSAPFSDESSYMPLLEGFEKVTNLAELEEWKNNVSASKPFLNAKELETLTNRYKIKLDGLKPKEEKKDGNIQRTPEQPATQTETKAIFTESGELKPN